MAISASRAGALSLCLLTLSGPALADGIPAELPSVPLYVDPEPQGRERLGTVRLFTNDWFGQPFGDRDDRWRTGAYQVSAFWGPDWRGSLPDRPFQLMQYTIRGEIIAPDNLSAPAPGDRLYAPALYIGAATHFEQHGFEFTLGADLAITGEQTRLMDLHDAIHRTFGGSDVDLTAFMIEDGFYLNATGEAARTYDMGGAEIRPFVEAQAGVETLVRAGVDLRFGGYDNSALLIRDPITGQRIVALPGTQGGGWSFAAGADVAYVHESVLLPDAGPEAEDMRYRLRGGLNYNFGASDVFYGVTYMSEEFVGQDEGQLVGSLSVMIRF